MECKVESLFIYPIKSCQGISVKELSIGPRGPYMDRNWVVINDRGQFLSQREHPLMSQIQVQLSDGVLRLFHERGGEFHLSRTTDKNTKGKITKNKSTKKMEFQMWGVSCWGYESNVEASEWFSHLLGEKCYLLSAEEVFSRSSSKNRTHSSSLVYADGYPLLAVSVASINNLLELLGDKEFSQESLIRRFRPNLVLSGLVPHEEDVLGVFQLGDVKLSTVKDCPRCVVVNVDPHSGNVQPKILKTLSHYRKSEEGIVFGQNLVCLNSGTLKVGDLKRISIN